MCSGVLGVDKELVRQHCARVQSAGDEEVQTHSVALRHIQDRLGLDDPTVYVLYSDHCAVQRRVRHDLAGSVHATCFYCQ